MVIADPKGKRRAAFGGALLIRDAVNADAGNGFQAFDQTPDDFRFMGDGGKIGRGESFASRFRARVRAAAEFGEVFNGGADAGNQFVNLRAAFPAIGNLVGARSHFVWTE